jgi:hypothetical protein
MDWQPIETAPKYADRIRLRTSGGAILIGFWHNQLMDSDGGDCGGWAAAEDEDYPPCWTEGICWEVNEDSKPSDPPTHWQPAA